MANGRENRHDRKSKEGSVETREGGKGKRKRDDRESERE